MSDKKINIISTIVFILLIVGTTIFKGIPEYKETIGSSDNFLSSSNYEDMIEFKINNSVNFSIVVKESIVTHILYFNKESLILYNQNIEKNSVRESLKMIFDILKNSNKISDYTNIELTKYEGTYYNQIKKYIQNNYPGINIIEKTSSLEQKASILGINETKKESIIFNLGIYSKEIINKYKDKITKEESLDISEQNILEYANNVYQKLQNYVITNNIENQDINSSMLPISLIPANKEANFYPSTRSWYYISNYKIYAYIVFDIEDETYDYCYQGTIEEYKKGEC